MKKIFLAVMVFVFILAGCRGVVLDENEEIVGNGTWQVTKGGSVYTVYDNTISKDNVVLYEIDDMKTYDGSYKLFALGEYLYVNTEKGAMQLTADGKTKKKFGSGEIIAAKGRWIYYQSDDNKVKSMIVYKIDMKEGRQLNVFQDTIEEVMEIDNNVFYFKGISGNEYINELNDDNGYFYGEWLGEDVTEDATEDKAA